MSVYDRKREAQKEKKRVSQRFKKRYHGVVEIEKCELCNEEADLQYDRISGKMVCLDCFIALVKSPEKPYIKGGVLF